MKLKDVWLNIAVLMNSAATAQDTSTTNQIANTVSLNAYIESYYNFDFNRPKNNMRRSFLYHFTRHNEVNLNLGLIKLAYTTERIRAHLAVAAGTYMNTNYATEPATLKNIFQADAGYKLSAKKMYGWTLVSCLTHWV